MLLSSACLAVTRSFGLLWPWGALQSWAGLEQKSSREYQIPYTHLRRARLLFKIYFWSYVLWCVWPKFVHTHVVKIDKIHLNTPIFSRFKGCGYNSRATSNGAGTATACNQILIAVYLVLCSIIRWIIIKKKIYSLMLISAFSSKDDHKLQKLIQIFIPIQFYECISWCIHYI